jgi:anti-sigma factor RsiW
MAPSENQALDDELLKRYLLGALPEAETERLHELSVTDEELAGRLDAVETDLVDAYVRGELPREDRDQFNSFYLASPKRREKVRLAEGFLALEGRTARAASIREAASQQTSPDRPTGRMTGQRFWLQWGLAAASLALLMAGGYLLSQNLGLRKQLTEAQSQHAPDPRVGELERQLAQERLAKDQAVKDLEQARGSQPNLEQLKTVSVLLPPPLRSAGPAPAVSVHPGTDLVVLVLPVEADDFPAYQARLKDPRTQRVLWSSARLAIAPGERKTVSISFRAGLLKRQNYIVELTGLPSHGAGEVIGGYPFSVVLE